MHLRRCFHACVSESAFQHVLGHEILLLKCLVLYCKMDKIKLEQK